MNNLDKEKILNRANNLLEEVLNKGVTRIKGNRVVCNPSASELGRLVSEYKLIPGPGGIRFPE